MSFLPAELIRKKRFGGAHSPEEIQFLIQGYAREEIPDYQMSAWLMAVCFSGMTDEETAWLTREMRDSGLVLDLSHLGTTVDKHSTGGIGDKTSLLLAPIVAALGIPVPMMAGRGLAHTGGTLDKLESIPGFNVGIGFENFKKQLGTVGAAIIGQTREICPADRKLYALRDVTGTVDSYPLICGSIMSKKLAEGMSALVLDVKAGSGAFMKTAADAEGLARALMGIGQHFGKKVTALITRMDEPLGRFAGNALEVRECLDLLENKNWSGEGKNYGDTLELTLELAAHMILLGGKAKSVDEARELARKTLQDGSALKKFREIVQAQGGSLDKALAKASYTQDVNAEEGGFFCYTDLEKMGLACVHLDAGRAFQSDTLDHAAGLEVYCEQGQKIEKGQTLFKIHCSGKEKAAEALPVLKQSYSITKTAPARSPLVMKVLT
jgi:pyrimidine-nucleoside phosphorylase